MTTGSVLIVIASCSAAVRNVLTANISWVSLRKDRRGSLAKRTEYHLLNPHYHEAVREVTISAEDVSDGHHTMSELYLHRHALFIALCKIYDNYITPLQSRVKCWKSQLHDDGTMFEGWFILGMTITEFSGPPTYITYHLPMSHWNQINVMELEKAPKWDGHTSDDVLVRLLRL